MNLADAPPRLSFDRDLAWWTRQMDCASRPHPRRHGSLTAFGIRWCCMHQSIRSGPSTGLARRGRSRRTIWALPVGAPSLPRALLVVLDNASLHHSQVVHEARPRLWARGIYLYSLPPYSLELSAVERIFRVIKHHDLSERVDTPLAALEAAVDDAYVRHGARLLPIHHIQPWLTA
jgi:transposase